MNLDEDLADLMSAVARHGLLEAIPTLEGALRLARTAHARQQRSDGAEFLAHPVRVARLLLEEWKLRDAELIAAALLHDALEEGQEVTLEVIEEHLGQRVRGLVSSLSRAESADPVAYLESLATDRDALLIKIAERMDNLRDLLTARWTEADKRSYVERTLSQLVPVAEGPWPDHAIRLRDAAQDALRRIEAGEGDIPDVGPHQDVGTGGAEDPILVCSPHVSFFRRADDVYLYHDLVGDVMQLHEKVLGFLDFFREPRPWSEATTAFASEFQPEDLEAFLETLTEHLVLIPGDADPLDVVRDWHPLRGPWIVSHTEPGGQLTLCYKDRREGEVVLEHLGSLPGRLFQMCGGNLKISEIIRRLERQFPDVEDVPGKVRQTLLGWTHSRRQLLKLLPRPRDAYDMIGLPPYAISTMPYPLLRESVAKPPPPVFGTRDYHKVEIDDADAQFDQKETTLSHALRIRHPALGGRTYGAALAAGLLERDLLPSDPGAKFRAVEVGGGTGFFAKAFLDGLALAAPRLFNRLRYTIMDLSPALRASQRERTSVHADKLKLLGGDAERLPFADQSVDFIISNEVIADLRVAATRRINVDGESGEDGGPGAEAVRRFGLDTRRAPGLFYVNIGAFAFLEEIERVLKPGGTALLTEYGSQTRFPEESTHLDHAEFSIQFGHLLQVGARLGLECSVEQVGTLISLDEKVEVLETTQSFFETLRAFLRSKGVALEKLAYTHEMLSALLAGKLEIRDLQGLKFTPCGQRILGLRPQQFLGLLVRKPLSAGRKVKKVVLDL